MKREWSTYWEMDREELIEDIVISYPKTSLLFFTSILGIGKQDNKSKSELAEVIISSFTEPDLFKKFMDSLSPEARKVLYYLTWYGITTLKHIEEFYSISIGVGDFYGNSDDPFVKAIKSYNDRNIHLATSLRSLFKKHLEPPKGYNIEYIDPPTEIIKGGRSLEGVEEDIPFFLNEEELYNYPQDKKILKRTVSKFIKRYKLKVDTLEGAQTLVKLLTLDDGDFTSFKGMLKSYIGGCLTDLNIDEVYFYKDLRGVNTNYAIRTFLKRGRYCALSTIRELEVNSWVSVTNLVLSLALKEETEIFDTSYFGSVLYRKGERDKPLINKIDLCLVFIEPLVLGLVNLLYTLGGVDIKREKGKIESFSINDRGLKLFGRVKSIKPTSMFKFNFLNSATIIETNGVESPLKEFFQRVGERIGDRDYIVTPKTFFINSNDINEVEINIERLKSLIEDKPGEAWEDLFTELENRIEPLYNEQELIIVNLPLENDNFTNEVMDDPKLSSLFSLVEGGRIAFTRENYRIFKKEVRSIGYFIT